MEVKVIDYNGTWREVKDLARATIGKEGGQDPDSSWKLRILFAEHSPIRQLKYTIRFYDIPYWIAMHFARHKVGVEHYVSTQRDDRTGEDRDSKPQDAPVMYTMVADAQAIINISKVRLCNQAHVETRKAWEKAILEIRKIDPELAMVCVPQCVYRGFCPEFKPCGYVKSDWYAICRDTYVSHCLTARGETE